MKEEYQLMSQIISMDTEKTFVTARLLQSNAEKIDSFIEELNRAAQRLNTCWDGGRSDDFTNQFRSVNRQLEKQAWELSNLSQRLQHEIDEWEAADKTLQSSDSKIKTAVIASVSAAGSAAGVGQVLGASTTNLDSLSWKDKFDLERRLATQINEIEGKYHSEEDIEHRITQIDKEIEKLEKEREIAQRKADRLLNKIIPDFPFESDDEDGVAWRVRTDDFEDQVKGYDEQIAGLRAEHANLSQYQNMKAQQQEINNIFENRLRDVNPKNYPSCALYAAARRPDLGSTQSNFEIYEDGAAANYIPKFQDSKFQISVDADLRDKVGTGFAVVWEPKDADPTYGHVAIVEEVGKDYVIVSHAGWSEGSPTRIPISKLQNLWLIP